MLHMLLSAPPSRISKSERSWWKRSHFGLAFLGPQPIIIIIIMVRTSFLSFLFLPNNCYIILYLHRLSSLGRKIYLHPIIVIGARWLDDDLH